jgi:hypothetical protein
MEIDTNIVLEDILEQNKQLTLQLSVTRAALNKLQKEYDKLAASNSGDSNSD